MSKEKTHYRKVFNSPYLSSADIVGNTVLTVYRVQVQGDKSKKTKDSFNTMYFKEKELRKGEILKPMILNAGNCKIMYSLSGSHFIEDWAGLKITIYVDSNVRFGRDTVEGLRISSKPPMIKYYSETDFKTNFDAWTQIIENGDKTAKDLINQLSQRLNFTATQLEKLNTLTRIKS